ncbi:MAG: sugar kinase [Anaerolineae bacterium]|nr:sugar kinase [Anaerolineae bacterium]
MSTKSVFVIGDANVDLTFWKRSAAHTQASNAPVEVVRGGAGANTAVALARQGIGVSFSGMVGDDSFGRLIRGDLERERIDTASLLVHPVRSTMLVIYAIDEAGALWSNAVHPALTESALFDLAPGHIPPGRVEEAAWVHVAGFMLLRAPLRDTVLSVLERARQAGVPASLDLNLRGLDQGEPAGFRAALDRAISLAAVVLGSASDEFSTLVAGLSAEDAARQLVSEGRTVVLRMAERGAMALTPGGSARAEAFPVQVVSPIGAGDAWNAGYIAARLDGADEQAALRRGNATAALRIGRPGAAGAPTAAEVDALLGR